MDETTARGILDFMQATEKLKSTLRCAYTSAGRQESAADHSWHLGLLCMACAHLFPDVSMEKLLKLSILHDLGEALCGDIPAILQTAADSKERNERKAVAELCASLPDNVRADFLSLWDEYAAGNTLEARLAKSLDKMETLIQHNQGRNPADFDYAFNLEYGRKYTDALPAIKGLRTIVDEATQQKIKERL